MKASACFSLCLLFAGCPAAADSSAYIVVQYSALAGFRYYEGRSVWEDMKVGDPLQLRHEADNPHDPHAVRVEWRGRPIGYVPRRENGHLARQLDHGVPLKARVTRLEKSRNGRNRVSYEIYVPLN
ncbi:MAG TPA: HIRAN domain-containing protein [Burkholderiales bacterium]|nr:HIRAN domain-containing protein [Burkholderiales bacterium]